jgi:hypothetical protein
MATVSAFTGNHHLELLKSSHCTTILGVLKFALLMSAHVKNVLRNGPQTVAVALSRSERDLDRIEKPSC